MRRRSLAIGITVPWVLSDGRAQSTSTLRMSAWRDLASATSHAVKASTDWAQALGMALTRVDPGLRFVVPEARLHSIDPIASLSKHELDIDLGAVATDRRRSHMAFLEGPPLFRHRLRLASRTEDRVDLIDRESLVKGSQTHPVMAARSSAAADFLRSMSGLRWVESDRAREDLLPAPSHVKWWMVAEHLWDLAQQRPPGNSQSTSPLSRRWRLQSKTWWDESVHGAVSLAVPRATRKRID